MVFYLTSSHSLPKLQSDVKTALDRTNAELAILPAPLVKDPSSELLGMVTKFCTGFGAYVEGTRGSERLIQDNLNAYIEFKSSIRHSAPDFRPFVTVNDTPASLIDVSEVLGDEPLPERYDSIHQPIYLQDVRAHISRYVDLNDCGSTSA